MWLNCCVTPVAQMSLMPCTMKPTPSSKQPWQLRCTAGSLSCSLERQNGCQSLCRSCHQPSRRLCCVTWHSMPFLSWRKPCWTHPWHTGQRSLQTTAYFMSYTTEQKGLALPQPSNPYVHELGPAHCLTAVASKVVQIQLLAAVAWLHNAAQHNLSQQQLLCTAVSVC